MPDREELAADFSPATAGEAAASRGRNATHRRGSMANLLKRVFKKDGDDSPSDAGPAIQEHESAYSALPPDGAEAVSLTHVWADEPNAVKLKINRLLMPLGEKRTFKDLQEAADTPLAQALFAVEGVISVELESSLITVFMHEEGDWDVIIANLPPAISAFFATGEQPLPAPEPKAAGKYNFGFKQVASHSREEQMEIVKHLLDSEINPAVAAHGGFFTLIDVKDNTVYVQLGGGCQGCGMADVTLRQGVEERMKQVLPEMVALIDTTDHASGNNPYYQPGK